MRPEKTKVDPADLRQIPGVGPRFEEVFRDLEIRNVSDLRGREPEQMFDEFCSLHGGYVDRCVLYVFRCAVYYAEHQRHDPELLKWWNWKDRTS